MSVDLRLPVFVCDELRDGIHDDLQHWWREIWADSDPEPTVHDGVGVGEVAAHTTAVDVVVGRLLLEVARRSTLVCNPSVVEEGHECVPIRRM